MVDLDAVLREIRSRPAPHGIRLVGVDGPAGSGKSTLAGRLSEVSGAPIVRIDDFLSWTNLFDGWWGRLEEQVVQPLLAGRAARFQVRDWHGDEFGDGLAADWVILDWAPLVILEGVTCTRSAISDRLAYRVWVQAPRDQRLRRGLARDGADHRELWLRFQNAEEAFFAADRTRERADLIVDAGDPEAPTGLGS